MAVPSLFPLVNDAGEDFAISDEGTQTGTVVDGLDGMRELAIYGYLSASTPGSGAVVFAFIQTSFAGAPWFDVACFNFEDATVQKAANISSGNMVPQDLTDQEMTDDTVLTGGPLGDRLRAVVVTEGSFASPTTLALRVHAR